MSPNHYQDRLEPCVATHSRGIAVPKLGRFEDLLALPIEVWIDESHVRRVRFERDDLVETVELWDFGTPLDDLDGTRLPTFRSPEEAESLAADKGS